MPSKKTLCNEAGGVATIASNRPPRQAEPLERGHDAVFQALGKAFEISEHDTLASLQREDFREGVAHFPERRASAFTGK